jgi:hypothetical protein
MRRFSTETVVTFARMRCAGERLTLCSIASSSDDISATSAFFTRSMWHTGQAPGRSDTTEGCMGQVQTSVFVSCP